jgi:hypothetical protein
LNLPGQATCITLPRIDPDVPGGSTGTIGAVTVAPPGGQQPSGPLIPVVQGDPHVRVAHENEPAICFDIDDENEAVIDLISDLDSGLEVNAQLYSKTKSKHVTRMQKIGFITPAGVEVGVFPDRVTIGRAHTTLDSHTYDIDFDLGLDDVHITIHSLENSAKRGITLSIGDYSELRFQVFIKNGKDSMSFRIERSGGFSSNLTGILGEVFRGPRPYHVDAQGAIHVGGETIPSDEHYWHATHGCRQITTEEGVRKFLGHSVSEYRVSDIFARFTPAWIQAALETVGLVPKRK